MTQVPTSTPAAAQRPAPPAGNVRGEPLPGPRRFTLAPNWLQVLLIVAILGAAGFVALDERYLWSILLAIAGLSFGASYVLRRMVGDDYDRS